jgi:hypothetical protein
VQCLALNSHWAMFYDVVESEVEEWDDDALSVEECLFCPHASDSLEKNVKHMTTAHSFFIPDVEYLVDLEGFISYLGKDIPFSFLILGFEQRLKLRTFCTAESCVTLYYDSRNKEFSLKLLSLLSLCRCL